MSIVLFAPFAPSGAETGIMYLLGNYLRFLRQDVFQLRCNGVFSLCDRDSESGWKRNVLSCATCVAEQRGMAKWGSIESRDLSTFLQPDEIEETWRNLLSVPAGQLTEFKYRGVPLFDLCRGTFRDYFGVEYPEADNELQEKQLRSLLMSTLRMSIGIRRFNNRMSPKTALVTGGQDFMTRTFIAHSVGQGIDVMVFQWTASDRAVNLINLRNNELYSCEFIVNDLREMRNNPESWSADAIEHLHNIMEFIGIPFQRHLKRAAQ